MSGDVSPVYAPDSSARIVCAPIPSSPGSVDPPPSADATAVSQRVGGQMTVLAASPETASRTPTARRTASALAAGFIFQLPAMSGARDRFTSAPEDSGPAWAGRLRGPPGP